MAYTTVDKSGLHFKAKLYTGNGSTQSITGVGFQPDWVWLKRRDASASNELHDAVRGATKRLKSDATTAEYTDANTLTSFDSDGFSLGSGSLVNTNSASQVSWNWKANGQGSANSDGTITTTYTSANTTSGFSIVKYTGNGTSGATVGHGLGSAPTMIIVKELNNATDWFVYHHSIGATKYLKLNATDTEATTAAAWNDTAPTSSVFSLGNGSDLNGNSDNYIAYCFAEKPGFSKAGLYEGNNNADGTFVYTGFKPSFIMIKGKGIARNWTNWDDARSLINPAWNYIYPNLSSAGTNLAYGVAGSYAIDFVSNGFKVRNTDDKFNGSGQGYIYLAFGQTLVGSNNVPCTAR